MRLHKNIKKLSFVTAVFVLISMSAAILPATPAFAATPAKKPPASKPAKKPPAAKPAKVSTPPSSTGAQSPICPNQSSTGRNTCNLPQVAADTGPNGTLHTILQVFFGIIGAFALLMMTASGFKYITAAGNPQKVSEAKSGVIYALVGLMLAVTAEAIVAFVIHWGAPS